MLGPGPEDDTNVPKHMCISSQKLHPGSGCLTVRVTMDGPVRVLQINDISQRVSYTAFRYLTLVHILTHMQQMFKSVQ